MDKSLKVTLIGLVNRSIESMELDPEIFQFVFLYSFFFSLVFQTLEISCLRWENYGS